MALIEFKDLPDATTPLTADNLNNNFIECFNIIESGSNENGNYIKYSDGTMICYGVRSNTLANNNTQIGAMWYTDSVNLGSFPVEFAEEPIINLYNIGAFTILEHLNLTSENIGNIYMGNGTKREASLQKTMFIAIGKWQ